jgi:hypothetical protein
MTTEVVSRIIVVVVAALSFALLSACSDSGDYKTEVRHTVDAVKGYAQEGIDFVNANKDKILEVKNIGTEAAVSVAQFFSDKGLVLDDVDVRINDDTDLIYVTGTDKAGRQVTAVVDKEGRIQTSYDG